MDPRQDDIPVPPLPDGCKAFLFNIISGIICLVFAIACLVTGGIPIGIIFLFLAIYFFVSLFKKEES